MALIDTGEAMRELGEVKDALDMEVKQNFIDPLQNLHDKDLKEIQPFTAALVESHCKGGQPSYCLAFTGWERGEALVCLYLPTGLAMSTTAISMPQHHLKKMEGRRLDFDYKKKRQGKVTEEEIKQALEKFDDSKEIAEQSMFNLLENDIEQVSQLSALVQAQLDYHRQATEILQQLSGKMDDRIRDTSGKPRKEYVPKPRIAVDFSPASEAQNGGLSHSAPARSPGGYCYTLRFCQALAQCKDLVYYSLSLSLSAPMDQPCCRALYDFDPENEGELGFKEGDIITLTNKIDENWYEGMLHGQSGFFPVNYVDILVALPH
ncbi:hypothetical protein P4O66_013166 [Electrophorus voltai]|uniref:Endophilin-A1 n=1 Tax=Electrophorus voltai TaxID=2609070 RepID=A0AAD8Z4W4_9TELE|nr:hypothetical protein P4O66_013166 [Electrophorus voltai]